MHTCTFNTAHLHHTPFKIAKISCFSLLAIAGIGILIAGSLHYLPNYSIPLGGCVSGSSILLLVSFAIFTCYEKKKTKPKPKTAPPIVLPDKFSPKVKKVSKEVLKANFNEALLKENWIHKNRQLHLQTQKKQICLESYEEYDPNNNSITVENTSYRLLSSEISTFIETPFFSYGVAKTREIILFNPKSNYLNAQYQLFKVYFLKAQAKLKDRALSHQEILFKYTIYFMQKMIFPSSNHSLINQVINSQNNPPLIDHRPCISIDRFIKGKAGVCRHHTIVAAYFLDRLMRHHPGLVGDTSLSVQIVNSSVTDGRHTWLTLVSKDGNHWCLDTLNKFYGKLSDKAFQKSFESAFGAHAFKLQMQLANERYALMLK